MLTAVQRLELQLLCGDVCDAEGDMAGSMASLLRYVRSEGITAEHLDDDPTCEFINARVSLMILENQQDFDPGCLAGNALALFRRQASTDNSDG